MKPVMFMLAFGSGLPILFAATSGCTPVKPVDSAAEAQDLHQLAIEHLSDDNFDHAIRLLDRAIEMRTRLVEQKGRRELEGDLARSYRHRGDVRHRQGKLNVAIRDFGKAIDIYARLVEEGREELAYDLARSLNVRAIVYLQTGNQEKAIGDMKKALLLLNDARLKKETLLKQAIEDMLRDIRGR